MRMGRLPIQLCRPEQHQSKSRPPTPSPYTIPLLIFCVHTVQVHRQVCMYAPENIRIAAKAFYKCQWHGCDYGAAQKVNVEVSSSLHIQLFNDSVAETMTSLQRHQHVCEYAPEEIKKIALSFYKCAYTDAGCTYSYAEKATVEVGIENIFSSTRI